MSLDTLRALAGAATPGPWFDGDPEPHYGEFGWAVYGCPAGETEDSEQGRADAAYIAAASPDRILALLDERAELLGLLRIAFDHASDHRDQHGRLAPGALCWCYSPYPAEHRDDCPWLAIRAALASGSRPEGEAQ